MQYIQASLVLIKPFIVLIFAENFMIQSAKASLYMVNSKYLSLLAINANLSEHDIVFLMIVFSFRIDWEKDKNLVKSLKKIVIFLWSCNQQNVFILQCRQ